MDTNVTVDKAKSEKKDVGMFTYYKGSDDEWYCESLEMGLDEDYMYSNGDQVSKQYRD